jgi:hypothetical protein
MAARKAFHARSGGVSTVINATACGLIQDALRHPERIGKVLAGPTLAPGNRRRPQYHRCLRDLPAAVCRGRGFAALSRQAARPCPGEERNRGQDARAVQHRTVL